MLELKFLQLVFCSVADFVHTRLFLVVQLFDLSCCSYSAVLRGSALLFVLCCVCMLAGDSWLCF
jgi:hypothetical protein